MAIIRPSVNLVAHPNGVLPSDTFFTRGDVATKISNLGSMVPVGLYNVRHDFNSSTREYLGILLEKAVTNLISATRELVVWTPTKVFNGGWSAGNGITLASIGTETSGFLQDTSITCTTVTGVSGGTVFYSSANVTAGTFYTFSAYIKAKSAADVIKTYKTNGNGTSYSGNFSVNTGEWTRVYVGFVATTGVNTVGLQFQSSNSLLVDCCQLEAGDLSSYVSGARSQDTMVISDPGTLAKPSYFDILQGTFYMQYRTSDNATKVAKDTIGLLQFYNNTVTDAYSLGVYATTTGGAGVKDTVTAIMSNNGLKTSGTSVSASYASDVSPQIHKVAVSYQSNSAIKICVDGQTPVSSASNIPTWGILSSSLAKVRVGNFVTPLDSHLQHFAYFPTYMSSADLISLTS